MQWKSEENERIRFSLSLYIYRSEWMNVCYLNWIRLIKIQFIWNNFFKSINFVLIQWIPFLYLLGASVHGSMIMFNEFILNCSECIHSHFRFWMIHRVHFFLLENNNESIKGPVIGPVNSSDEHIWIKHLTSLIPSAFILDPHCSTPISAKKNSFGESEKILPKTVICSKCTANRTIATFNLNGFWSFDNNTFGYASVGLFDYKVYRRKGTDSSVQQFP